MRIYTGRARRWHRPFMQTMSKNEVDRAIALSACSVYVTDCLDRASRII
jgi:hypothetical protein